jgi:hypothetical protein
LFRPLFLLGGLPLVALVSGVRPAAALTIVPYFDSSITGAGVTDTAQVESAINDAIGTIDSLYTNTGSVGIVFSQGSGSFLGQSETADYNLSYSGYTSALTAASTSAPSNSILSTAVANLASGNKTSGGGTVFVTSADGRVALGQSGMTGCFNSGGAFVNSCGQPYDGVVTLTTSYTLNYGKTPVAGEYSAVDAMEHEIDEILGGGGQGSVLNQVADCASGSPPSYCAANNNFAGDLGVLDLYRYSAPGVASFTTSGSATSYLSVDGGVTDIVGFNQSSSGDFGDFSTCDNVQSAASCSGIVAPYNSASPEVPMMESIGYNGVAEPASMAMFASGLAGLRWMRRRRK